jgi:hypothetical protein
MSFLSFKVRMEDDDFKLFVKEANLNTSEGHINVLM